MEILGDRRHGINPIFPLRNRAYFLYIFARSAPGVFSLYFLCVMKVFFGCETGAGRAGWGNRAGLCFEIMAGGPLCDWVI